MSFKDKPLKKIVADTRVTIDALHNDIVKDFQREREEYLQNGFTIYRKFLSKNCELTFLISILNILFVIQMKFGLEMVFF